MYEMGMDQNLTMAFHPRPQIASDLGRNVTRSSNLHLKSRAIPEWGRHSQLMAADSNRNGPQPAAIWESQAQPAPTFVEFCTPQIAARRPQS